MTSIMKKSERLKKKLIELRGTIIHETIRVEAAIDSILIAHYMNNDKSKKREFHEDIISPMNFNDKKNLIIKVFKKLGYDKLKISELKLDLTLMQELRNKIAHWNWVMITDKEVLLGKTDYIQFAIDEPKIESFHKAKNRATAHLTRFLFKYYDPFKDVI